jgi:drug/metabolite transporter (DMT)-like permease
MTALLARYIHGEMLKRSQWTAILIEFTGVALLTLMDGVFTVNMGIFWLLLAAVSLSAYNLFQRKLTKIYSALQTTSFSIFAGTLMLSAFAPAGITELYSAPVKALVALGILGVFSSAVAYVAWAKAMAKAKKTSTVSNYMFVTPFLASLLGFLLAGEKPDLATVAGGCVIIAGMIVYYCGEKIVSKESRKEY